MENHGARVGGVAKFAYRIIGPTQPQRGIGDRALRTIARGHE